jgi:hypothetical protein
MRAFAQLLTGREDQAVTWFALLIFLYPGVCAGWSAKAEWDEHGHVGDAIGGGIMGLLASPFIPFMLVIHAWGAWRQGKAETEALYAAFGGYKNYKRLRHEQGTPLPKPPDGS